MSAVFSPRAVLVVRLAVLALLALAVATVLLFVWRARAYEQLGEPIAQPIPFSHKHHVGDDGIDCRYCHTTVETEAHAGLPSTAVCLGCHSQLYRDQPLLALLHRSAASHQPIAWQRVHVLPDFVYFNHAVHVAKGVACVECHGRPLAALSCSCASSGWSRKSCAWQPRQTAVEGRPACAAVSTVVWQ